jgi:hypothetical protein
VSEKRLTFLSPILKTTHLLVSSTASTLLIVLFQSQTDILRSLSMSSTSEFYSSTASLLMVWEGTLLLGQAGVLAK